MKQITYNSGISINASGIFPFSSSNIKQTTFMFRASSAIVFSFVWCDYPYLTPYPTHPCLSIIDLSQLLPISFEHPNPPINPKLKVCFLLRIPFPYPGVFVERSELYFNFLLESCISGGFVCMQTSCVTPSMVLIFQQCIIVRVSIFYPNCISLKRKFLF